ncbi:MAG: DoxX family protein [Acidobacteria bacterium]|nr:MAG: DoxX family protein [Acidobacteriota bacterium]
MATEPLAAAPPTGIAPSTPRWRLATRIAFRFCFVYFGLYILLTQMLTSLLFVTTNDNGAFELDMTSPARAVITWIGTHVFHLAHMLTRETGSGDRHYDWVELALIFVLALAATFVWSVLDRKREQYTKLFRWFRVVVRFALGATLLTYGIVKIFPLQMSPPGYHRLLEPYGSFSPMGVLWASIGAAPGYEFFAGCAEFLGGALLLFPRTAILGALIALADATQVFLLNMTYDVPVKILSGTLILLSVLVLAPEAQRLWDAVVRNRPVAPSRHFELCRSRRANRIALGVQVVMALFLILGNVWMGVKTFQSRPPQSPLAGLWQVETFTLNNQPRPPLVTDAQRWQHVFFVSANRLMVQTMPGNFESYKAALNTAAGTLALTPPQGPPAQFTFRHPTPDQLFLTGTLDNARLQVSLQLIPRSSFRLVSRGFHWVQDAPFDR